MKNLVSLDEIRKNPIRANHYDEKNGKLDFVLGIEALMEYIESLPTIEAERVVYCKDCKHHEAEQPGMVYCSNIVGGWVSNYFYCADGKRKDDGINE